VSKYLSPIIGWEAPDVTQETSNDQQDTPDVPQETPDNLQETPDVPQATPDVQQENFNDRQGISQVRQVDIKMAKFSWRDLPFDAEVNTQLLDHFCRRSSDKNPSKPSRLALLQLLLKNMVASGKLIVDAIEEGVPILRRGDATHVTGDVAADVMLATARETHLTFELQSQSQTQLQHCHGQTPTQLAQAGVKLPKMALDKVTRTAQERSQEEAQEVKRKKQEVTADSNKLKKEARYKALRDKLGRLPACPRLCRGEECTGIPCGEEEPGFPYSHINDMVVCTDKAHVSMTTWARCLMFHQWPKRSPQAPPAGPPAGRPKNSGRGTSGPRQAPPKRHTGKVNGTQRPQQPRGQQQQQQQQRDLDHQRVIERLNFKLEVTRTNADARTNGTSYANVVKVFTSPPPPLPLPVRWQWSCGTILVS
jgi:hypothetical protein